MQHPTYLIKVIVSTLIVLTIGMLGIAAAATAQSPALRVDFAVSGSADLLWGVPGVYSDNLSEPPPAVLDSLPDLGEIELGLWLEQGAGDNVSGYVDLSKTLVFSTSHTVALTTPTDPTVIEQETGPAVTGTFDGTNLTLTSERVDFTTAAGQAGQRQFQIVGMVVDGMVTGEYRETVWGYSVDPQTVVGEIALRIVESEAGVPTTVGTSSLTASTLRAGLLIAVVIVLLVMTIWFVCEYYLFH